MVTEGILRLEEVWAISLLWLNAPWMLLTDAFAEAGKQGSVRRGSVSIDDIHKWTLAAGYCACAGEDRTLAAWLDAAGYLPDWLEELTGGAKAVLENSLERHNHEALISAFREIQTLRSDALSGRLSTVQIRRLNCLIQCFQRMAAVATLKALAASASGAENIPILRSAIDGMPSSEVLFHGAVVRDCRERSVSGVPSEAVESVAGVPKRFGTGSGSTGGHSANGEGEEPTYAR